MRVFLFLVLIMSSMNTSAQEYTKYWVQFTDKNNTPYSLDRPEEFLSQRAMERRARYNISYKSNDLPVNPQYVSQLSSVGATILYTSKWFNGTAIEADEATWEKIKMLSFIKQTETISKSSDRSVNDVQRSSVEHFKKRKEFNVGDSKQDGIYYGTAAHQIQMLNGDLLHAEGFTGEGMMVAVMDAGFIKVNEMDVFQNHYTNGQILGTFDFVEGDENVYAHGTHGTHVFSIMGGNLPGTYVGAAPNAQYWLFRTEDGASETRIEEYNWIAAAEFADSVGVDVINTSLGYSKFDNPDMDYTAQDLTGDNCRITIGADIASSKGILMVSSAGNQGNSSWKYITAPADGDSVLAVGSVDSLGVYSSFSSLGYDITNTSIKPNVSGMGRRKAYVTSSNALSKGNGTSYSSPLVAGLMTCLWQANPELTNYELIKIIESSSSQANNPDEYLGYGLPDFYRAYLKVTNSPIQDFEETTASFLYPNPFENELNLYYYSTSNATLTIELFDLSGRILDSTNEKVREDIPYNFSLKNWGTYPKGVYLVKVTDQNQQKILKAFKIRE